jgi:hypothetical protein
MPRNLDDLFAALSKSKFRAKFHLQDRELKILHDKGLDAVMQHARDLITQRLAPANISNDGRQTPWRGHPVFIAQHATACCCRGCLEKWHGIPNGKPLSESEINYILSILRTWLTNQTGLWASARRSDLPNPTSNPQAELFPQYDR